MIFDVEKDYFVASISGGKDSTALLIYLLKEIKAKNVIAVFADTGWEHDWTYEYLDYLEGALETKIHRVKGQWTFKTLAVHKKRIPSPTARFCTTELKLKPMRQWIMQAIGGGVIKSDRPIIVCGVRGEESPKRAAMPEWEDEDDFYGLPNWKPLLKWTWKDVFQMHEKHGIKPNPLYKAGMSRVGCMPCIMARKDELKQIAERFPDVIDKCEDVEKAVGDSSGRGMATFWNVGDIPERWCSVEWTSKSGEKFMVPTARDVFTYCQKNSDDRKRGPGEKLLFPEYEVDGEPISCESKYGLCE